MERVRELWRQETEGLAGRVLIARLVLAPLPDYVGSRIRPFTLRMLGFRIGPGTLMMGTPTISGPRGVHRRVVIGRGCIFNVACHLEAGGEIVLEDGSGLGHEVMILTTSHHTGDAARRWGPPFARPVRIGAGAWLGSRSLVLPGVTIGRGAIVAAGALVNRDVPPHAVVAGVPAKLIRQLDPGEGAPGGGRTAGEATE